MVDIKMVASIVFGSLLQAVYFYIPNTFLNYTYSIKPFFLLPFLSVLALLEILQGNHGEILVRHVPRNCSFLKVLCSVITIITYSHSLLKDYEGGANK